MGVNYAPKESRVMMRRWERNVSTLKDMKESQGSAYSCRDKSVKCKNEEAGKEGNIELLLAAVM